MSFIADMVANIGMLFADMGTSACPILFTDEPVMPKCLIEK